MEKIEIDLVDDNFSGWTFEVFLGDDEKKYTVSLEEKYYERLTRGHTPPERLVELAFVYLLEQEPKESILRKFDLKQIKEHFPEFEAEMQNQNMDRDRWEEEEKKKGK